MPPRKKNTAKKSCGGSAKKLLAPVSSPLVPAASHTESSMSSLEPEDTRTTEDHSIEPTPYFGFYHNILPEQGGTPVLPGFLQLKGKYELASSSILAATPLAIVHFILGGKDRIPTPVPLLSHYLDKFYPSGGFLYIEILFDVASYQQIDNYTCNQVRTVSELTSHLDSTGCVFAFLSNHSEEDSGWLFAGKEGQGEGEYVAMKVQHVLSTVLKPYARILKSSHIVFLVCGSVVAHETPYTQLKEAILQFDFQLSIRSVFPTLLSCCKLELTTFARAHTETSPWGLDIPAQCPQCGSTKSWAERVAVTVADKSHDEDAPDCVSLPPYKLSVTKPPGSIVNSAKTKNCAWFQSPSTHFVLQSSAVSTQGKHMNEGVPTGTAKKARRYYLQFLTDADDRRDEQQILGDDSELEEELGMSPEDRELVAHPKDAGFYKKELNAWDVAQKLFKQEMDDYDKEQQQKKGIQHSIKYRTGHAREWFNSMSSAHRKEVEEARDKWNRDGTPAESQAMYQIKNLKKVFDDFTEQMRRTMGYQLMMLASHKKNADQTLSVKIHESQPVNQKKSFSQSSRGSKEWTSEGFEKYAKWSKAEFYPTNDDDDSSNEEMNDGKDAMPEVILDNHEVFTGSMKPVPWLSIADSICNGFSVQDPSHLRVKEINKLWGHWEARKASKQRLIIFVGAASAHMNKSLLKNAVYVGEKKSKKKYVEVDDEEGASAAPTPVKHTRRLAEDSSEDSSDDNLAPSAGLIARPNREYLLFISSIGGLKKEQSSEATEWPAWATWSWEGSHLPNSVHSEVISSAKISGLASAMKYEADDATPNTPSYLGTSILGIKTLDLVIEAINTARGGVTRMVKAKEGQHAAITEAGGEEHDTDTAAQTISTREEEVDDEKKRKEDEMRRKVEEELRETEEQKKKMAMLQEDMRKLEEENQKLLKLVEVVNEKDSEGKEPEKAEEEEEEVVQKRKKRGKSGGSGRPSKKATTDNIR
ncbi:uncharacterized protein F5891DRAFT_981575 [Suillus fuscotomentosus]|uniref:Uncharacterized protein n=1 Tax=Suillus fuscotomentosus TaxID=1912939 RepID=A0AAD4E402_9AGAM|nr:uncharacterized protein F5891DRAFT_981575 [Suillus fuscotomentosus]KAG1898922.1 hypothetical protein F5891DRAFT_981575 [Suillus fuscotomentosus]